MLRRKFYDELLEWKQNKKQECLLVRGARQIGKTYIIEYFGKENYENYIYLNFIENAQLKSIFDDTLSADDIYSRMTLLMPNIQFKEKNTLIFLDEIQECPNARAALKFLALDDRYDVVASGSLLGISYKEVLSIPVGYELSKTMYSLDFEEFLWAKGYDDSTIFNLKQYYDKKEKVPEVVHTTFMKLLREYIVVGGMPAVVQTYIDTNHFGQVQQVQEQIITSYLDDISKYASQSEKPKVKNCYLSVTKQLAKENKKFQFSVVEKKSTARKFENSIEWLRDAGLVWLCKNVLTPQFPLKAYENDSHYKMYISDLGLLIAMYGFEMKQAIINDTLSGPIKGGIYENLIADMLIKRQYSLNHYQNNNLEIEFLIEKSAHVVPIEVKAGNNRSKSMDVLLNKEDIQYGYKFINGNIGIKDKKITLPLYMAMFI